MPFIRRAESHDARRLAELAERTFRETFESANTRENMNLHCSTHFGEPIQEREILDPSTSTLVCEDGGELIGYAQLRRGPAPHHLVAARPVEILRLYVAKEWHGRGIAQELMAEAIRLGERNGADLVWLGVWEHNPRAIAFYRKFGFEEDGSHTFPLGHDPQRDIIMKRSVNLG